MEEVIKERKNEITEEKAASLPSTEDKQGKRTTRSDGTDKSNREAAKKVKQ